MDTLQHSANIKMDSGCRGVDASALTSRASLTITDTYDGIFTGVTGTISTASTIKTGAGNDTLDGCFGSNILAGGDGTDTFRIGSTLKDVQTIEDFSPNVDKLELNTDLFGGMMAAKVTSTQFLSGAKKSAAEDADQRFIYDTESGKLYFDADGNGAAFNTVYFATLSNKATLTADDISIMSSFNYDTATQYGIGSSGNDKLVFAEKGKVLIGGGGDDLFLVAERTDDVKLQDFSAGDKIGLSSPAPAGTAGGLILATGSNITAGAYSITNGLLTATDGSAITAAIAEAAFNEVRGQGNGNKGLVLAYEDAKVTHLLLYASSNCDIELTGVSDITGVTITDGYVTGFTAATA